MPEAIYTETGIRISSTPSIESVSRGIAVSPRHPTRTSHLADAALPTLTPTLTYNQGGLSKTIER